MEQLIPGFDVTGLHREQSGVDDWKWMEVIELADVAVVAAGVDAAAAVPFFAFFFMWFAAHVVVVVAVVIVVAVVVAVIVFWLWLWLLLLLVEACSMFPIERSCSKAAHTVSYLSLPEGVLFQRLTGSLFHHVYMSPWTCLTSSGISDLIASFTLLLHFSHREVSYVVILSYEHSSFVTGPHQTSSHHSTTSNLDCIYLIYPFTWKCPMPFIPCPSSS